MVFPSVCTECSTTECENIGSVRNYKLQAKRSLPVAWLDLARRRHLSWRKHIALSTPFTRWCDTCSGIRPGLGERPPCGVAPCDSPGQADAVQPGYQRADALLAAPAGTAAGGRGGEPVPGGHVPVRRRRRRRRLGGFRCVSPGSSASFLAHALLDSGFDGHRMGQKSVHPIFWLGNLRFSLCSRVLVDAERNLGSRDSRSLSVNSRHGIQPPAFSQAGPIS